MSFRAAGEGRWRALSAARSRGVLIVGLGTLVVPLDSSVNVAFPEIIRSFGLQIPAIEWVVICYMLTFSSLMLVFGRIGDMSSYRCVFLIGTAWSSVAFALCGSAPSFPWLLAARVAQGVGGGLILSVGPALATSLFPEESRGRVLGIYTMMFGIGTSVGPIIAGILIGRFGWSGVFWYRMPIALAAFVLAWTLPASARARLPQRFDWPGAVLLVVCICALLLALDQLQHVGETVLWLALLAALSGFALAFFIRTERRSPAPIIALTLFGDVAFSLVNIGHVLIQLASFSVMLLLPFYLNRATALSVPQTGLVLALAPLGIVLAAPLAGALTTRISAIWIARLGCGFMSLGLFSVALAPPFWLLAPLLMSQGFGLGLFQVAYFDLITGTLPLSERGVAGALGMVTRTSGVTMAATVLMLVFQTIRGASLEPGGEAAFLLAFRATFCIAAVLPLITLALLRPTRRHYSA